ncbi:MAG: hypothetical protein AB7V08_13955 [Elusimicrobiales bacterium]
MKVITHMDDPTFPNEPDSGKLLVELDRYEFQAIANVGRLKDENGNFRSMTATNGCAPDAPAASIEVNGTTYAAVGPAKPKDWRPPVGSEFYLRLDLTDAEGTLRQALRQIENIKLLQPVTRPVDAELREGLDLADKLGDPGLKRHLIAKTARDPAGLGRLLHALFEDACPGTVVNLGKFRPEDFTLPASFYADNAAPGLDLTAEHVEVLGQVCKDAMEHGTGIFETAVHIKPSRPPVFAINRILPLEAKAKAGAVKEEPAPTKRAKPAKARKPAPKKPAKPTRKARR